MTMDISNGPRSSGILMEMNTQASFEMPAYASVPRPAGSGSDYFMPISLENRYYSRSRVRQVARLFLEKADTSVIVPCDRLRALSYMARSGVSEDQAVRKADDECSNMMRMLRNVGLARIRNCHIIPMSVFYRDPSLTLFIEALEKLIMASRQASAHLDRLTDQYLEQFYEEKDRHAESRALQRTNVLHAAGFGLFVTEKLGYSKEIYKVGSGLLQTYLYAEHKDLLRELLGKERLEREFIELAPLVP